MLPSLLLVRQTVLDLETLYSWRPIANRTTSLNSGRTICSFVAIYALLVHIQLPGTIPQILGSMQFPHFCLKTSTKRRFKNLNKKRHLCKRQEQISTFLLQSSSMDSFFLKQIPICLSNLSHIFDQFLLCFRRAAAHGHLHKQFPHVSKPAWSIFFLIVVYSIQFIFFYSWAISSKIKESHSKLFCFLMTQAFLWIHFWSHHPMWPAAKWK